MFKFDGLPQLAVGGHREGSGMACIMNAVSYLNGDKHITDTPDCVWRPLAETVQVVNDGICRDSHPGSSIVEQWVCHMFPSGRHVHDGTCVQRPSLVMCPSCTHKMWMIGARLIGTAHAAQLPPSRRWAIARAMLARCVEDFVDQGVCQMLIEMMSDVLSGKATPQDAQALMVRCSHTHYHGDRDQWSLQWDDFIHAVTILIEPWVGSVLESWENNLANALRATVSQSPDMKTLFVQMLDVFEKESGLEPIPPSEEEVSRAAQRAGLALV